MRSCVLALSESVHMGDLAKTSALTGQDTFKHSDKHMTIRNNTYTNTHGREITVLITLYSPWAHYVGRIGGVYDSLVGALNTVEPA